MTMALLQMSVKLVLVGDQRASFVLMLSNIRTCTPGERAAVLLADRIYCKWSRRLRVGISETWDHLSWSHATSCLGLGPDFVFDHFCSPA